MVFDGLEHWSHWWFDLVSIYLELTTIAHALPDESFRQAGSDLTNGPTPNDGYAVYPGSDVYVLDTQHAAALKARDGSVWFKRYHVSVSEKRHAYVRKPGSINNEQRFTAKLNTKYVPRWHSEDDLPFSSLWLHRNDFSIDIQAFPLQACSLGVPFK